MKNMTNKMMKVLLACFVVFSHVGGTALADETVVIKGSTTVLPVAQVASEAYMKMHPGINISLSGGGSGNGIKALIDGSTDIATSSRDIKPKESQFAQTKSVSPVPQRIAIDAIVPIVHPDNPVTELSIEQLSLIYQGKIRNWKEVGGKDLKIVVVSRDTSSGTYEVWEEKVLHKARVTPRAQLQASNGSIIQTISRNRYAVGYIGLGYLNKSVRPLRVGGTEATVATVLSGAYPVARPLFMFTNGWPTGTVADFINFTVSTDGQELVRNEGFVPLSQE